MQFIKILKYKFSSLARYVILSCALMIALDQIGKFEAPLYVTTFFALVIGLLIGLFRIFIGFDFLRRMPFLVRFLVKVGVLQVIILISAGFLQLFMKYFELIEEGIQFGDLLVSRNVFTLYYKTQLFSFIFLFFIELEDILGPKFLSDYILGKYYNPTKEHRIMLFMDLRHSTALTEKMGDEKYYHFINETYHLLNKPLIYKKGEILKYVGDEVIVSWKYQDGIDLNNCVEFFIEYKKTLEKNKVMFLKKYGAFPEFKAGMHHGDIVAAYLGDIKKQLDFSGDVMNTTARIMDYAKKSEADILISDELFYALDYADYDSEKIPNVQLKGKEESINLTGLKVQTKLH